MPEQPLHFVEIHATLHQATGVCVAEVVPVEVLNTSQFYSALEPEVARGREYEIVIPAAVPLQALQFKVPRWRFC